MCAADTNIFDRLISKIRNARRITVLTGAGVSAASGVPTFRGEEGLWRRYRAADLATPDAFARDPKLVWEWYAWRCEKVAACAPLVEATVKGPAEPVLHDIEQRL